MTYKVSEFQGWRKELWSPDSGNFGNSEYEHSGQVVLYTKEEKRVWRFHGDSLHTL